jgi:hypothetical protein
MPKKEKSEAEEPEAMEVALARRLAAAVISWQTGDTLDYTYKKYCQGEISESWVTLAKAIIAGVGKKSIGGGGLR